MSSCQPWVLAANPDTALLGSLLGAQQITHHTKDIPKTHLWSIMRFWD